MGRRESMSKIYSQELMRPRNIFPKHVKIINNIPNSAFL
jgi:hypothetical protein